MSRICRNKTGTCWCNFINTFCAGIKASSPTGAFSIRSFLLTANRTLHSCPVFFFLFPFPYPPPKPYAYACNRNNCFLTNTYRFTKYIFYRSILPQACCYFSIKFSFSIITDLIFSENFLKKRQLNLYQIVILPTLVLQRRV